MALAAESERPLARKKHRGQWYPEMRTAPRPPEIGPKSAPSRENISGVTPSTGVKLRSDGRSSEARRKRKTLKS
jgi:hypothetical protein